MSTADVQIGINDILDTAWNHIIEPVMHAKHEDVCLSAVSTAGPPWLALSLDGGVRGAITSQRRHLRLLI